MGKIVKFCASCEEGFAEKFSFCPNCASELSAFEMKPVDKDMPVVDEPTAKTPVQNDFKETSSVVNDTKSDFKETSPVVNEPIVEKKENILETPEVSEKESEAVFEPINFSNVDDDEFYNSDDILEINVEEPVKEPIKEREIFVTPDIPEKFEKKDDVQTGSFLADQPKQTYSSSSDNNHNYNDSDGYHVTVVSEKGGKFRNGLLLGAFALIAFGFLGLIIYSLFSNLDNVASLNDDPALIALIDAEPMQVEEKVEKKDDDKGGGGGGGGRDNPKPVSSGELPSQQRTLPPPPQVVPRLDNPELKIINRSQGDNKRERTDRVGIPGALGNDPSSGPGTGGGIGTGKGTGVGSGFGTGEGSGSGSGSGGGSGNGNGNGTGDGSGGGRTPPPPPPPKKAGPTVGIKILSKPKPGYTDEARQNNVRGVVRVNVTFLANGSIGGVSVVQGLPNGLTEKAIAAARQIRFEPPMRNGEPYSVKKVVVFNFNIY